MPGRNSEDLWHPHLKRSWIDNKESLVIDHKNKDYLTNLSLIQLTEGTQKLDIDNSNDFKNLIMNPKLSCKCRFLKHLEGEDCKPSSNTQSLLKPKMTLIQKNLIENGISNLIFKT